MDKNNKMVAWFLLLGVNSLPLLIWLFMAPWSERFGGFWQILTSLGQISALLGFSLMATTIILTARFRWLEKNLRGLNRVFINHHLLGSLSFILLLFHPLVLAIRYLSLSINSAAIFLLPSLIFWQRTLGTISLAIMILLLIITFYLGWRYHLWKFSHRFLVLAFLIGFLHTAFIESDVSRNLFLRFYLLSLGGITLIAYAWRLAVEFGGIGKKKYVISNLQEVITNVWEVSLRPKGEILNYQAGQFAFLSFIQAGIKSEEHPFSFTSAPGESELKFVIKNLGDFTSRLGELKVGAEVLVEGPYGVFGQRLEDAGRISAEAEILPAGQTSEIWIAGGVGITPFISLAKDLKNNNRQVDLYVVARSEKEAIGIVELKQIAQMAPNLKLIPYYDDSGQGFLSADKVEQLSGSPLGRQIYICGPAPMMRSLKTQFINKGVDTKNIHTEEFSL